MDSIRPLLEQMRRGDPDLEEIQSLVEAALRFFRSGRDHPEVPSPKEFNAAARKLAEASRVLRTQLVATIKPQSSVHSALYQQLFLMTSMKFPLRVLKELTLFEEVLGRAMELEPSGGPSFDKAGHLLALDLAGAYLMLTGKAPSGTLRHASAEDWYRGNKFAAFFQRIVEAHDARLGELRQQEFPAEPPRKRKASINRYRLNDGAAAVRWGVDWHEILSENTR